MSRLKEAIEYDGRERMDREVERKISSGETPLSDNPALPGKDEDEFDNNYLKSFDASNMGQTQHSKCNQITKFCNATF